jgi:hypothetical protein
MARLRTQLLELPGLPCSLTARAPTTVMPPDKSGALQGRHLRDHRRAVLDAPTDLPQLLGAALVLAHHCGPHRAGSPDHDLEAPLGPLKPRLPRGELRFSRLQLDERG